MFLQLLLRHSIAALSLCSDERILTRTTFLCLTQVYEAAVEAKQVAQQEAERAKYIVSGQGVEHRVCVHVACSAYLCSLLFESRICALLTSWHMLWGVGFHDARLQPCTVRC